MKFDGRDRTNQIYRLSSKPNKKKKYISLKLKRYTDGLFDHKCFFCKRNLTNPKKGQKHYHHFMKESDGSATAVDCLVLVCVDCHRKVHSNIKLNGAEIRNILMDILTKCLNYSSKTEFISKNQIFDYYNLKGEYLYFRKEIYLNLCTSLRIIPTKGDMYNYDDDLTFKNYGMIPKHKVIIIQSILSRLDKRIGGINIKRCHNRWKFTKIKKEDYYSKILKGNEIETIMPIALEWYDSIFIENDRKKLDSAIREFIKKYNNHDVSDNDSLVFKQILYTNQSHLAKHLKKYEDLYKKIQDIKQVGTKLVTTFKIE